MHRPVAMVPLITGALLACTGLVHRVQDVPRDGSTSPADVPMDAPSGPPGAVACEAPGPPAPAWYHHSIGYEVFVRSFQDSDGDGIGDLAGLTSRLDYLNDGDPATEDDLGVDLLWLMPIHESPSYHGYDVTDYGRVDPDYGTDADLDRLLSEAHARGIHVVLDLVLNHTSDQHPWFIDSGSGPASPHRDWYVWSTEKLDWSRPWGGGQTWFKKGDSWYYALFSQGMPDLNWRHPPVRDEMTRIGRSWLERGVDGFRLDAIRYLAEDGPGAGQADTASTHAYLAAFRKALAGVRPDALLVGEAWAPGDVVASYFGSGPDDEVGMLFDFDLASALVEGISSGRAGTIRHALCARLHAWPAWGAAATFLANHDMVRVATAIKDQGHPGLRLAAALLFGLPGTPWVYYGEEIGMRNGDTGDDTGKRLPMQWEPGPAAGFSTGDPWQVPSGGRSAAAAAETVAGQAGDPESLLSLYRRLTRVRSSHPALRAGSTRVAASDPAAPSVLVLVREQALDRVVLAFNLSDSPVAVSLHPEFLPAAVRFDDLLGGPPAVRTSEGEPLDIGTIDAWGFRYFFADPGTSGDAH